MYRQCITTAIPNAVSSMSVPASSPDTRRSSIAARVASAESSERATAGPAPDQYEMRDVSSPS